MRDRMGNGILQRNGRKYLISMKNILGRNRFETCTCTSRELRMVLKVRSIISPFERAMRNRKNPDFDYMRMSRRHFLRNVGSGIGLTVGVIPLLEAGEQMKKVEGTIPRMSQETRKEADAVLMIWLEGGPGNDDLWNPSQGGEEFRGPFKPIQTSIPSYQMTELFPKTARNMDRIAVVNSLYVSTSDHFKSSEEILMSDGKTTLATEIGQKKMAGGISNPFFWVKGQYQPDSAHKADQQFRFNDDGNGKFERPPLPRTDVER